jgi:alpha-mannosidase
MNNYWHTNYRAEQGGAFQFRYVITSAAQTDAPALSRLGWEEVTPLEHDQIRSQDKALNLPEPLPARESSFLSVNDPDVLVDTWKIAEDGRGTIVRLLDLGGASRTITIRTPLLSLSQVIRTDAVERDGTPIVPESPHTFRIEIRPHQIVTLRLLGQPHGPG